MRCALQISLLYYFIIPIRLFSERNFDFEVPEGIIFFSFLENGNLVLSRTNTATVFMIICQLPYQ